MTRLGLCVQVVEDDADAETERMLLLRWIHIDAAELRVSAAVAVDVDVRTMQRIICGGSKDGRKMMHFLQYQPKKYCTHDEYSLSSRILLLLMFEHHDGNAIRWQTTSPWPSISSIEPPKRCTQTQPKPQSHTRTLSNYTKAEICGGKLNIFRVY